MKYVCQVCNELCDEAFAVDGEGYFCSKKCYDDSYPEDEEEEEITGETVEEILKEPNYSAPTYPTKRNWWRRE